jgi:hypothetical protein
MGPKAQNGDFFDITIFYYISVFMKDHLWGLVVKVPGYRSRGPEFYSRRYQIFWELVGLKQGLLNLVSTIEELLRRNSSGSSLERQEYGHRDPFRSPRATLYPEKFGTIFANKRQSLCRYRSLTN